MQFVADFKFRGNDAECERLYKNYRKAKGELVRYLSGKELTSTWNLKGKRKKMGPPAATDGSG